MSEFTRDNVKKLSAGLNEPQWMLDFRLNAWDIYENTPMPKTSDEEWRRTDLRRLKLDQIGPSVNGDAATGVSIPDFLGGQLTTDEAGGNMLQIDGVVEQFTLSEALKEQGVIFCDMHTAVRDYPELVQEYFMTKGVPVTDGKFAALHGAFWRGGTFLYVPKNTQAAAPLHTVLWSANGKTFTHTLVVLELVQRRSLWMNMPQPMARARRCTMV